MKITLPPNYNSLAQALVSLFGNSIAIAETDRLSGGDINKAYGLTLTNGKHVFMKANSKANAAFFTAEAAGLKFCHIYTYLFSITLSISPNSRAS